MMTEIDLGRIRLPSRLRDTAGFALAVAIFALVLLAAIVAGGYFSASQEFQIGRGMRSLTTSFYAGEVGILDVLDDWDPAVLGALQPGDTLTIGPITLAGGGRYNVTVVRVGAAADSSKRYYYVEAAGRPPARLGERRQAMVVRSLYPDICCSAAVKSLRQVMFGGGSQPIITGNVDDPPDPWSAGVCAGIPGDSAPGVWNGTFSIVNDVSRVEGVPPIFSDPSLTPENFFQIGNLNYTDLVQLADFHLPAGYSLTTSQPTLDAEGDCDTSNPQNWGEPTNESHPCFDYFPVIHVNGNLDLTGSGYAQGILLVDGDLKINGPFDFYGIAFVQRDLDLGGPVEFYGAAYAGDDVLVNGATPRFYLSRCAAERAERLSSLTRPQPLPVRAWVQLF